ncbi:Sulfotransferase family cytosolic 1B member 1 [Araneus ventricosus]|uniref:Sulfotransferase family cytosolic 1B member 1 n=1 Tax=Araneus ventricosus TaxID=182803 RepID=A0A4Y2A9N4_ARAVE|nr:Sulfotransferase family cytosolic 1B member 1 [Araneus ventricosus]
MPFPKTPWCKRENVEKTMDYLPRNGDIILTSYPKTGSNWLQYIVLQIISKGEYFPSLNDCLYSKVPLMELMGPEAIDNMRGSRIYRTHYRYDVVQKNPKSKVLYIYRKPEDTLISWCHFYQSVQEEQINLDEFFEDFLEGKVQYGNYFDHVLSYLAHKDDDNLLLISYEKLHANRKEEILRMAKFLGEEFYQSLSNNESLLEEIIVHTSFDYMKKNLVFTLPHNKPSEASADESERVINYFRKGTVGDGKKSLSLDQLQRLQKRVVETIKDTEVLKQWLDE